MDAFLKKLDHFFLFLFIAVVMIDPTNSIFHAKELSFALLMLHSMLRFKPDMTYLPHILIILSSIFLAYLSAEMQGNPVQGDLLAATFKNIAPLALLPYICESCCDSHSVDHVDSHRTFFFRDERSYL